MLRCRGGGAAPERRGRAGPAAAPLPLSLLLPLRLPLPLLLGSAPARPSPFFFRVFFPREK